MPSLEQHVAQAEHNERAYEVLEAFAPIYGDWQTTCLFYAALHYVDAYLAGLAEPPGGIHPRNHTQRQRSVALLLREIYLDYWELEVQSRGARYDLTALPDIATLYTQRFTPVRTALRTILRLPD